MKKYFLYTIYILMLNCVTVHANESYQIHLIRHADKVTLDPNNRDPELTKCGLQRAQNLIKVLEDIKIDKIYSTDYKRTQATAKPIAQLKKLSVISYNPSQLNKITELLTNKKENALVVGHNSTTNVIAGNLAGITLPIIDEKEFDKLYQVTISGSGASFKLLNQNFKCDVK